MKKIMVWMLLALLLLLYLPAGAEEDWATYVSVFGFSIQYPADLIDAYGVPAEEAGLDTEAFIPQDTEAGAALWCCMITDPGYPAWEEMGWQRVAVDEPSVEMQDVPFDRSYALYLAPDGAAMVEEIRLECPVSVLDCPAGFEYVFDLRFPTSDPDGWRKLMEAMLETVEFLPQPAVAGSFRLDFFQGGAAGMRFIDVIVDEDAADIVLLPQYTVTDFALEKVTWNDETFQIASSSPLYTADRLGPGDNLKITCWFSDVLPDLRIRCTNEAGDAECWYLFQSGFDGSLLLLSEEEVVF